MWHRAARNSSWVRGWGNCLDVPRPLRLAAAGTSMAWAFWRSYTQASCGEAASGPGWSSSAEGRELELDKKQPCGGSGSLAGTRGAGRSLGSSQAGSFFCPVHRAAHGGVFTLASLESGLPRAQTAWARLRERGAREPWLCPLGRYASLMLLQGWWGWRPPAPLPRAPGEPSRLFPSPGCSLASAAVLEGLVGEGSVPVGCWNRCDEFAGRCAQWCGGAGGQLGRGPRGSTGPWGRAPCPLVCRSRRRALPGLPGEGELCRYLPPAARPSVWLCDVAGCPARGWALPALPQSWGWGLRSRLCCGPGSWGPPLSGLGVPNPRGAGKAVPEGPLLVAFGRSQSKRKLWGLLQLPGQSRVNSERPPLFF